MMVSYIGATENSNNHRLASLSFNNGADGLNGRGKDEENSAWDITKGLIKKGYDFIFAEDEEFIFEVEDKAEFNRFAKDFRQLKQNYSA